ncbi:MAG TPA: AraC family transcriptional regulator [Candidatus Baltobacteraceae bacterium]|jgi:AraC family transcriptional regulator
MDECRSPLDEVPMQLTARESSRDRHWTGFHATIYDTTPGYLENQRTGATMVSMHLSEPLAAACRCDGAVSQRLRVRGDLQVIPIGSDAAWQHEANATEVAIFLEASLVHAAAEGLGLDPERSAIAPNLYFRDPRIEHLCWALKHEVESADPLGRVYAESLGMALATHLLRRSAYDGSRRGPAKLSQTRLRRVIAFIDDHLSHDLSLVELARVANLSPSHLKTLFRDAVGLPLHQHVIRRRVRYAIDAILSEDLPLSELALRAGFANQSHMARCMRRVAGLTPSAVRRSTGVVPFARLPSVRTQSRPIVSDTASID